MSSAQAQKYDVIIVGGGMVGACMACALANNPDATNLRIAVVEGKQPPLEWSSEGFDLRVSAVSRASQNIFESIGAWQAMVDERVSPYRAMHVWDATGSGEIHFDSADIGEPTLGHIIENRVIVKGLLHALKQHGNIDLLCPATPKEIQQQDDSISINLEGDQVLTGKLVIGADGANSWVRQQAGISVSKNDYQQRAIVTTVKTEKSHKETAWQRFLPTGPLAFLPLTEGYSSIVWSTDNTLTDELLALDDETFKTRLQDALGNRLGDIISIDGRAAFPLRSQHAQQYVTDRIALIGDAAHTIHPLAGQGVNLGFADAATLAEVLQDAITQKKDIGAMQTLRRYERWRKGDNMAMLSAMTGFKTLFGNDLPVIREARNFGLNITNQLTPVKNLFIRHAMGMTGDTPKLARTVL